MEATTKNRYAETHLISKGENPVIKSDELTLERIDFSKLLKSIGMPKEYHSNLESVDEKKIVSYSSGENSIRVEFYNFRDGLKPSKCKDYIEGTMEESRGVAWEITLKGACSALVEKLNNKITDTLKERAGILRMLENDSRIRSFELFLGRGSSGHSGPC